MTLCVYSGEGQRPYAVRSGRRLHLDNNFNLSIEVQTPSGSLQHSLGHLLVSAYEAASETESPVAALVIPFTSFTARQTSSDISSLYAQVSLSTPIPARVRWEVADASTCQLDGSRSVCQTAAVLWQDETDPGSLIVNLGITETAVTIHANDGSQLVDAGLVTALSVTDTLGKKFTTSVEGTSRFVRLHLPLFIAKCVIFVHTIVLVPLDVNTGWPLNSAYSGG